jgi:hypothetical protein
MAQTAGVDDPLTCSRCQAMVSHDELGLGLAVRVNGELICPACIEQLPSEAQLSINRVRAMKGLGATTYRLAHPHHPDRALFTFSTAGLLNHHRRSLAGSIDFPTPVLPPSMSAKDAPRPPAAGGLGKAAVFGGIAAGVVLVAGIAAWLALRDHGGRPAASADGPSANLADPRTPIPPSSGPTAGTQRRSTDRASLPADALAAWKQAAADPALPQSVRDQIEDEIRHQRTAQLDEADAAIGERRFADALAQLLAMEVPAQPGFQALIDRDRNLRMKRFAAMRDPQAPPPPPVAVSGPATPAPVATTTPPPQPRQDPPTPPPTAQSAPGTEQETIDVTDLHVVAGNKYWKSQWRVVMGQIAGGRYDVWVRATCAADAKATTRTDLEIELDRQVAKIPVSGASTAWQRVFTDLTLKAGEHPVVARSASSHWRLRQIHLTGAGSPEPPPVPPDLTPDPAPTSVETPPLATPVQPVLPLPSAEPAVRWEPRLLFPANQEAGLPLDGTIRIPSPWPSPHSRFFASDRDPKTGRSTIAFDLPFQYAGSTIFVLVHPGSPVRKKTIACVEVDGKRLVEVPVEFPTETWTLATLDLSAVKVWTGRGSLRLVDTERYNDSRGMVVGPIHTVMGRAPLPNERPPVRPVLLMPDLYDRRQPKALSVVKALTDLTRLRRQAGFELKTPRILVNNVDNEWRALVRKGLQEWTGTEAVDHQVDELGVGKDWWTQQQYQAGNPLVDPERFESVVIVPNGAETQFPPDKLAEWARILAQQILRGDGRSGRGGMLPIFVIGVCEKSNAAAEEGLDDRWSKALADLAGLGVPVIDIRVMNRDLKADVYRATTAGRLLGGLRNLGQQILFSRNQR